MNLNFALVPAILLVQPAFANGKRSEIKYGLSIPISAATIEGEWETWEPGYNQNFVFQYNYENLFKVGLELGHGFYFTMATDVQDIEFTIFRMDVFVSKTNKLFGKMDLLYGGGFGTAIFDGKKSAFTDPFLDGGRGEPESYPDEDISGASFFINGLIGLRINVFSPNLALEIIPLEYSIGTKKYMEYSPKVLLSASIF